MAPTAEIAGFWGTPTSTVDFCEPNYAVSHFVAEFWNAVTSIPIALVGLSGMVLSRRQQLGAEQFSCYAVVCIVGLGSIAFHATLMRTGQVLDEVPMLWVSLTLIYGACQHVRDRRFRRKVADTILCESGNPAERLPAALEGDAHSLALIRMIARLEHVHNGAGCELVDLARFEIKLIGNSDRLWSGHLMQWSIEIAHAHLRNGGQPTRLRRRRRCVRRLDHLNLCAL